MLTKSEIKDILITQEQKQLTKEVEINQIVQVLMSNTDFIKNLDSIVWPKLSKFSNLSHRHPVLSLPIIFSVAILLKLFVHKPKLVNNHYYAIKGKLDNSVLFPYVPWAIKKIKTVTPELYLQRSQKDDYWLIDCTLYSKLFSRLNNHYHELVTVPKS